jgi:hypothetical protein
MNKNKLMIGAAVVVVVLGGWLLFRGGEENRVVPVSEMILGQWQAVEDAQLVREFKEGGAVTDWYGGAEVMTGVWNLFNGKEAPPALFVTADEETIYLRMTLTGEERDALYFRVENVDAENLELVYVGPGGVLEFTRVGSEPEAE